MPTPNGVQVVVLAGSRSQPVSEEQARPAIEQFLLNERKRKLVEDDLKACAPRPRSNTWASSPRRAGIGACGRAGRRSAGAGRQRGPEHHRHQQGHGAEVRRARNRTRFTARPASAAGAAAAGPGTAGARRRRQPAAAGAPPNTAWAPAT